MNIFSDCFSKKTLTTALIFSSLASIPALASDWAVRKNDGIFAIITHKTGVAAKFAHDHFITAQNYTVTLTADEKDIGKGTFKITIPVDKLEVDSPILKNQWFPKLENLAILANPFSEISDSDRAKVRENMLKPDQLDAAKFPTITAEMNGFLKGNTQIGKSAFDSLANIQITIKDTTVKKQLPATITLKGSVIEVSATLPLKFTMFHITPYSAMLGAVGNSDDFNLFVNFKADKK